MPSVHSAVVVALTVTALLREGGQSSAFGIAAVLAAIVMYDSFGVRRASGEQAAAINSLVESLVEAKVRFERPQQRRLREILGHTPGEVIAGALLGGLIAALFNLEHLEAQLTWLGAIPSRSEALALAGAAIVLMVGAIGFKFWQARAKSGSAAWGQLAKAILVKTQVLGWLSLLFSFAQYERVPALGIRWWTAVLLLGLVIWDVYIFNRYVSQLSAAEAAEAETARRSKWFRRSKKKR